MKVPKGPIKFVPLPAFIFLDSFLLWAGRAPALPAVTASRWLEPAHKRNESKKMKAGRGKFKNSILLSFLNFSGLY